MSGFYLSLGSNVGDREENLLEAIGRLREAGLSLDRISSLYETEPVGEGTGPRWFLNLAAAGACDLVPAQILERCLAVEHVMGRVRETSPGPRTIDIDLLLVDQVVVRLPACRLPHPRMHERRFVLEPLAEIAPTVRHPTTNLTVAELLAALEDPASVLRLTRTRAAP